MKIRVKNALMDIMLMHKMHALNASQVAGSVIIFLESVMNVRVVIKSIARDNVLPVPRTVMSVRNY